MVLAKISEVFSLSRLEVPGFAPRLVSATVSLGEKAMEIALRSQLVGRPFGFLFWAPFTALKASRHIDKNGGNLPFLLGFVRKRPSRFQSIPGP